MQVLRARQIELVPFAISLRGSRQPDIAIRRAPARLMQTMWRSFGRPRIDGLVDAADVVHATNFVLPPTKSPTVVTVHDLSFLRSDTFPGGKRLRSLVPWSIERADVVIVPTEAIAAELRATYDLGNAPIEVVYEGVAPVFFGARPLADEALARMGIAQPFVLAVGTIEPRKNLKRLLAAWNTVRADLADWTLVIAGPKGWGEELPRSPGVVLVGYVGDETLPGLLAAAELFCYPSLYEGFGLPPLEAMAAGVPAIVGRYSAAPEVVGDAACLVDPLDASELAGALKDLASDVARRAALGRAGRARAAGFTWEATAAGTIAAYEKAMRNH